ncbi:MAG: ATP-binding protein [Thermodesulfovibrionales bacterium]
MEILIIIILAISLLFALFYIKDTSNYIRDIIRLLKEYRTGNLSAMMFLRGKGIVGELALLINNVLESNQKQIEQAEEKTQMLEATLRGMSDGVLMTDKNGNVILANQTLKKLFGIKTSPEGKKIPEVIRNNKLLDLYRDAMDTWEIVSEEIEISINQKDMFIMATAVPMYSATSVTGVVFTLQDITRLKRLEEMRKDFVANVSHEIKTPLTAIRASAETLIDTSLEDKEYAMRFLNMIKTHSERLNTLVEDLLTLSRIELGDMPIDKIVFNIEDAIDTVILTFKERAQSKGLQIQKSIPHGINTIIGDKNKVIQILLNLVDNSIKFTEKGSITIGIMKDDKKLILYVEDTGIGIPKDHLDRLGERFYRVDRARSRELGGTGLGLAIVKHLVQLHSWQMKIESNVGKGTRVNIIIS